LIVTTRFSGKFGSSGRRRILGVEGSCSRQASWLVLAECAQAFAGRLVAGVKGQSSLEATGGQQGRPGLSGCLSQLRAEFGIVGLLLNFSRQSFHLLNLLQNLDPPSECRGGALGQTQSSLDHQEELDCVEVTGNGGDGLLSVGQGLLPLRASP